MTDTTTTTRKRRPPVINAAALRYRYLDAYLSALDAAGPPDDCGRPADRTGTAATFDDVTDEDYWAVLLDDPRYAGVRA